MIYYRVDKNTVMIYESNSIWTSLYYVDSGRMALLACDFFIGVLQKPLFCTKEEVFRYSFPCPSDLKAFMEQE